MIKEGKIVPAETTIRLLKAALESREVTLSYILKRVSTRTDRSGRRRSFIILLFYQGPYLVDGFPRSVDNIEIYEREVGAAAQTIFFELPEAR